MLSTSSECCQRMGMVSDLIPERDDYGVEERKKRFGAICCGMVVMEQGLGTALAVQGFQGGR